MRRVNRWMALLALTLSLSLVSLAGAQTDQSMGTASPTEGQPGTEFTFTAEGFEANEEIAAWLNTPGGEAVDYDGASLGGSDDMGRVEVTYVPPRDARPGAWSLVMRGRESGIERVAMFTVLEGGVSTTPGTGASPQSGPAGTAFTFTATGLDANEEIAAWLNTPGGEAIAYEGPSLGGTDENGTATFTWESPEDLASGSWSIVIRGRDSGKLRVILFTIS